MKDTAATTEVTRRIRNSSDSPAFRRFSTFLEERKCSFWMENELQEVLPTRRTRPDFFVQTTGGMQLLVEIESFEKERGALKALSQNQVMSGLSQSDNKRLSTALQHASNQLKPYRDLKFPTFVVLDDFRGVGLPVNVDILGLHLLEYLDPRKDRHHLSAIGWLLDGQSTPFRMRVFHNPYAHYPISPATFPSSDDEHWHVEPGEFWKRSV